MVWWWLQGDFVPTLRWYHIFYSFRTNYCINQVITKNSFLTSCHCALTMVSPLMTIQVLSVNLDLLGQLPTPPKSLFLERLLSLQWIRLSCGPTSLWSPLKPPSCAGSLPGPPPPALWSLLRSPLPCGLPLYSLHLAFPVLWSPPESPPTL